MESMFDHVLDDDEDLLKVFKPNRTKFFTTNILGFALFFLLFLTISVFAIVFPEEGVQISLFYLFIPIGIYLVLLGLAILFLCLYYKNVFYAYTDRRIVIRSGIFGVDYKCLDMDMIGAVNVNVSLIDKIVRKNTGTLTYGSMASPMVAEKGGSAYRFAHIVNPYETYKEIKAIIEKHKKKKESKANKE